MKARYAEEKVCLDGMRLDDVWVAFADGRGELCADTGIERKALPDDINFYARGSDCIQKLVGRGSLRAPVKGQDGQGHACFRTVVEAFGKPEQILGGSGDAVSLHDGDYAYGSHGWAAGTRVPERLLKVAMQ
jgi:hypothetical protein